MENTDWLEGIVDEFYPECGIRQRQQPKEDSEDELDKDKHPSPFGQDTVNEPNKEHGSPSPSAKEPIKSEGKQGKDSVPNSPSHTADPKPTSPNSKGRDSIINSPLPIEESQTKIGDSTEAIDDDKKEDIPKSPVQEKVNSFVEGTDADKEDANVETKVESQGDLTETKEGNREGTLVANADGPENNCEQNVGDDETIKDKDDITAAEKTEGDDPVDEMSETKQENTDNMNVHMDEEDREASQEDNNNNNQDEPSKEVDKEDVENNLAEGNIGIDARGTINEDSSEHLHANEEGTSNTDAIEALGKEDLKTEIPEQSEDERKANEAQFWQQKAKERRDWYRQALGLCDTEEVSETELPNNNEKEEDQLLKVENDGEQNEIVKSDLEASGKQFPENDTDLEETKKKVCKNTGMKKKGDERKKDVNANTNVIEEEHRDVGKDTAEEMNRNSPDNEKQPVGPADKSPDIEQNDESDTKSGSIHAGEAAEEYNKRLARDNTADNKPEMTKSSEEKKSGRKGKPKRNKKEKGQSEYIQSNDSVNREAMFWKEQALWYKEALELSRKDLLGGNNGSRRVGFSEVVIEAKEARSKKKHVIDEKKETHGKVKETTHVHTTEVGNHLTNKEAKTSNSVVQSVKVRNVAKEENSLAAESTEGMKVESERHSHHNNKENDHKEEQTAEIQPAPIPTARKEAETKDSSTKEENENVQNSEGTACIGDKTKVNSGEEGKTIDEKSTIAEEQELKQESRKTETIEDNVVSGATAKIVPTDRKAVDDKVESTEVKEYDAGYADSERKMVLPTQLPQTLTIKKADFVPVNGDTLRLELMSLHSFIFFI